MKFQDYFSEYIIEKADIIDLSNIDVKEISKDMERIENKNFSWEFSQDVDDIQDDFTQPGFFGLGLFENNEIKGYIYCWSISEDEYSGLYHLNTDDFPALQGMSISDIKRKYNRENTIYVSNFVIEKSHRYYVSHLLKKFIEEIRKKGNIRYITFDGLKETTAKLLFNSDGTPKKERFESVGLEVVFNIDTYYSTMALLEIK